MNNEDWADLIDEIRGSNCILVLGPETSFLESNGSIILAEDLLIDLLAKKIQVESHHRSKNLPLLAKEYSRVKSHANLRRTISEFYQHQLTAVTDLQRILASIPFKLIICATPDLRFLKAFEQSKPKTDYYNFRGNKKEFVDWNPEHETLLYYLYGSVESPDSLVITENDLLRFLVAVIKKDPGLPDNITSEFQDRRKSFLFLGFGFKNWYLRILLYVLLGGKEKQGKEAPSFVLEDFTTMPEDTFNNTSVFYHEEHKIIFSKLELKDFAIELEKKYRNQVQNNTFPIPKVKKDKLNLPKVFISYASEDRVWAELIYEYLKKHDIEPWLDKDNLRGGDRWDSLIEQTIKQIDYFVILQSESLVKKRVGYVNKEIYHALERQKQFRMPFRFIIPLRIDKSTNIREIDFAQSIDITQVEHLGRLVEVITFDRKLLSS